MTLEAFTTETLPELASRVLAVKEQHAGDRPLWFRGHACSAHTLTPGIMRGSHAIEAVLDRERRLLTRFRQRSLPYWPAGYPQTTWEHMFVMQHHGVPTRLLDWSENVFVAAFFAAIEPEPSKHGPSGHPHDPTDCRPTVWLLDPVRWNRAVPHLRDHGTATNILTTDDDVDAYQPDVSGADIRRQNAPIAMYGTHNSQRIVAQRGTFTIAGKDKRPMEAFAADLSQEPLVWQVTLEMPREALRRELDGLGITETMIFPDLAGLGRELDLAERWS